MPEGSWTICWRLKTRGDIYKACNFNSIVTNVTDKPFLPERSLDFVVSNCVLSHIPPSILHPELLALRAMLKDTGYMCMMIGHDDHWSFHDHSVNQFNYYRYSDTCYQAIFDTKFEYQIGLPNRSGRLSLTARDLRLSTIMRTSRMSGRKFARCPIWQTASPSILWRSWQSFTATFSCAKCPTPLINKLGTDLGSRLVKQTAGIPLISQPLRWTDWGRVPKRR